MQGRASCQASLCRASNLRTSSTSSLFLDRELRLGLLLEVFVAVLDVARRRAGDQVLDLHFALGLFVGALDDGARRAALVGIFELLADAVFRVAEIELGADAGVAQRRGELLAVGTLSAPNTVTTTGPGGGFLAELAEQR